MAISPAGGTVTRHVSLVMPVGILLLGVLMYSQSPGHDWISTSNSYANQLMAVEMKHHPEVGSDQGLSEFDNRVSQPTLADEDHERQEAAAVVSKLKSAVPQQEQKQVGQDLEIMIRKAELRFRRQDYLR